VRKYIEPARTLSAGLTLSLIVALAATYVAAIPFVGVAGPLTLALLIGGAWALIRGADFDLRPGAAFAGKTLLRVGIVLIGARLDFGLIVSAGPQVVLIAALMITFGIVVIERLGDALGVDPRMRLLLAVGQSICGASAVGAIAPIIAAEEAEVSVSVALCGIVGSVGAALFSLTEVLVHMPARAYGLLAGATLHEVAQVIAAAFAGGQAAGNLGTLEKLTRVTFLAPVAVLIGLMFGPAESNGGLLSRVRRVRVPWFVIGFLIVAAATSLHLIPGVVGSAVASTGMFLMVMAMAGMGISLDFAAIRRVGLGAMVLSVVGFCLFIGFGFVVIRMLHA